MATPPRLNPSSQPLVTRFAPSPTGYLHLGHVASAVYVWGLGRHLGATILLRIEDHDRGRCRPEYEQAIFDDLAWLGLGPDNPELRPGVPSPFRQSDSLDFFAATLADLATKAPVYGCDCTRRMIAAALSTGEAGSEESASELRYTGRCRERGLAWTGKSIGIRVALPKDTVAFEDIYLGPQSQTPARQCGDLLLCDRHGDYTYQFAVTADDLRHGVNLVIRGQDLVASTGRQIMLARRLGRNEDATFHHHPLIVDASGRKLGKRFFSEAIAKRRAAGERPEDVLGEAAYAVGLLPTSQPLSASELSALFS